jgi:hypothetical protein
MEVQDTPAQAPEGQDVVPAGNASADPQTSHTDVVATEPQKDTSVSPSTDTSTPSADKSVGTDASSDEGYRYLGKKYSDVNQLESAYDNAQSKISEMGREKGELEQKAQLLDQLLQGLQTPQQQSYEQADNGAAKEVELLKKEIRNTNLNYARMQEEMAIDEVVRSRPHLRELSDEIRATWRLTNKPLRDVVTKFEKLVDLGRNANKEDMLRKKEQAVVTQKGQTESPQPPQGEADLQAALASSNKGKPDLEAWGKVLSQF